MFREISSELAVVAGCVWLSMQTQLSEHASPSNPKWRGFEGQGSEPPIEPPP